MTTSPLHFALAYAARGLHLVPIRPGEKAPAIADWVNKATTEPELLREWYTQWPDHGIGIATGPLSGIFVLDVDVAEGKHGDEALADLEAQYGPLPETVRVITGSGGLHLYFRFPLHLDWELRNSADKLGPGLDIRAAGGQVLAPPTLHPTSGRPYTFEIGYSPEDIAIAEAPDWLLELLRPDEGAGVAGPRPTTAYNSVAWNHYNLATPNEAVAELLVGAGWKIIRRRGHVIDMLRPGKDFGISGTVGAVNTGVFYSFTPNAPGFEANRAYSPARVLSITGFDGDDAAADAALVGAGWGAPSHGLDAAGYIAEATAVAEAAFWHRRPFLRHVRQAAHSRYVSADAVLGACLARVAALTPPSRLIPPTVSSPATLATYVALVGPPGTAKSSAVDIACELIVDPYGGLLGGKDRVSPSSGEGIIEAYMGMVKEVDEEGKKVQVRKQVRDSIYVVLDEGSLLAKIGARTGATVMEVLRMAWSGSPLSTEAATYEKTRYVRSRAYTMGLVMNLQPAMAQPLLDDRFGGLPQRFLWVSASDATIPEHGGPEWPGPWPWVPFARTDLAKHFTLPEEVVAETRRTHVSRQRRSLSDIAEDIDAHRTLLRTKVAALLAVVESRDVVTSEDWELAGAILGRSDAVRAVVQGYLEEAELTEKTLAARDRTAAKVAEAVQVEEAKEHQALERAAKTLARKLRRSSEPMSQGNLRKALASQHRALFEDAVELAEAKAWIRWDGGGWTADDHGE